MYVPAGCLTDNVTVLLEYINPFLCLQFRNKMCIVYKTNIVAFTVIVVITTTCVVMNKVGLVIIPRI